MNKMMRFLHTVWTGFVFITSMLLLLPGMSLPYVLWNAPKAGKIAFIFVRKWQEIFSLLTRICYKTYGKEQLKEGKAYIFTPNHNSLLDSPGIVNAVPIQFKALAKKELERVPFFKYVVKSLAVSVDRSSPESRKESLSMIKKQLESGVNIVIFPEGTQNRSKEYLQPFYDGAFRLAINTETEIVPMCITNSRNLMHPDKALTKPGLIEIYLAKPISTKGMTEEDIPRLKQEVYDQMHSILKNAPLKNV